MAIYVPEVENIFLVYGRAKERQDIYWRWPPTYDHSYHLVPRPTIVHDKESVDDPHDNPSIALDETGHVWVFVTDGVVVDQASSTEAWNPTALICLGWLVKKR